MRALLSLSLPSDLAEGVKALADEHGETRSAVVAKAIRRMMREDRNRAITRELLLDAATDEPRWFDPEAVADSLAYTEDEP